MTLFIVFGCCLGSVGSALANQAGLWRGGADYGTRSNIDATADPTPASSGDFTSFVRIQNTAATGLYQAGHHKAGANSLNNCGANRVGWFEEWLVAGTGNYHCYPWGNGDPFYQNHLFTVTRDPNAAGYWRMYVDGNFITQKGPLGFNTGVSLAGGEWTGSPGSNYHARFGPPNITPWQFRNGSATAAFQDVTVGNVFQDADSFSVNGNPPRFTVDR